MASFYFKMVVIFGLVSLSCPSVDLVDLTLRTEESEVGDVTMAQSRFVIRGGSAAGVTSGGGIVGLESGMSVRGDGGNAGSSSDVVGITESTFTVYLGDSRSHGGANLNLLHQGRVT